MPKVSMPNTPLSWWQLILTMFKAYPVILPKILLLVLISSVVHLIVPWLFVLNPTFGFVGFVGFILLTWFFYTAILTIANIDLQGGNMSFHAAFRNARQRYLAVLASNIIFFTMGAFILLAEFALNLLFDLVNQAPLFVAIIVIINVVIFVLLYFAIPLIVLERMRVIKAFEHSVRLVKGNWWRTFIVLIVPVLLILGFEALGILFTGKSRMSLFTGYHFVMQIIFYPLIIAATIIVLNDLKLRFQLKQRQADPVHSFIHSA